MSLKKLVVASLCLIAVVAAASYAVLTTRADANASFALAELQVSNMTCGSCVARITEALEVLSGVDTVDVSVTTGISKIIYDPQLVEAEQLASTVTAAGYPASVKQLLSSDQYQSLQNEETKLAADYVARIGDRLISRTDFDSAVAKYIKSSGLQDRPEARSQAAAQAWQTVLQRTLLLQAADVNEVVVQNGEVDLRIQKMRQSMPKLDAYITTRYGSLESFQQQLKEDMVINRNIDQFVLSQVKDPRQKQQVYGRWYQDLVDNTSITIYDQQLKQSASSAGGCGGGCCG